MFFAMKARILPFFRDDYIIKLLKEVAKVMKQSGRSKVYSIACLEAQRKGTKNENGISVKWALTPKFNNQNRNLFEKRV